MSKLERRLVVCAIIFVVIYLGAAALTIQSRIGHKDNPPLLESAKPVRGEEHLVLAELFLPMMILLTISVCFIVAKKKRAKKRLALDETGNPGEEDEKKPDFSA